VNSLFRGVLIQVEPFMQKASTAPYFKTRLTEGNRWVSVRAAGTFEGSESKEFPSKTLRSDASQLTGGSLNSTHLLVSFWPLFSSLLSF